MRGSFKEGTRNNAVFVYAAILRSQRLEEQVVWLELQRLFGSLDQPPRAGALFTHKDLANAAKQAQPLGGRAGGFAGMTNQTIADLLDVTPEESELLVGPSGGPWPAAARFGGRAGSAKRADLGKLREQRHQHIRQRVDEVGYVPPARELIRYLESVGMERPGAPATILQDLRALGLENPRSPQHRKRKRPVQKQYKLFRK